MFSQSMTKDRNYRELVTRLCTALATTEGAICGGQEVPRNILRNTLNLPAKLSSILVIPSCVTAVTAVTAF